MDPSPLEFSITISRSMLAPLYQMTFPASIARSLEVSSDFVAFFHTVKGIHHDVIFKRQTHKQGGWRSDRDTWKGFLNKQSIKLGERFLFKQLVGGNGGINFSVFRTRDMVVIERPRRISGAPKDLEMKIKEEVEDDVPPGFARKNN